MKVFIGFKPSHPPFDFMKTIWFVHHVRELDCGIEDAKLIGVFETQADAIAAKSAVENKPGFCDFPEGFEINEHHLGRIGWRDGFVEVS